ncbi:helix-turn-helix transcriptional regulator [Bradyrhizobium sp. 160]|nr:helix-turn-helix transcriptional regulator [Bradyrhizobium sp. 160]
MFPIGNFRRESYEHAPKGTPPSGGNEARGETGVARQAAEFAAAFGRLIQEERKRQGLRQDELAMVSGTGKRFIVDLEAGKSTCQLGRSLHVANVLGLRIEEVLKGPKPAARTLPRHRTFPTATRRSHMNRLPVYFETREVGWITAAHEASAFTYAESWRGLTGAFLCRSPCRSRGRRTDAPDQSDAGFLPRVRRSFASGCWNIQARVAARFER